MRSRETLPRNAVWLRSCRREHAVSATLSLVFGAVALAITAGASGSLLSKVEYWVLGAVIGWIAIRFAVGTTRRSRPPLPAPVGSSVEGLGWTALATGIALAPYGLAVIVAGEFDWVYAAGGGGIALVLAVAAMMDGRRTRTFEATHEVTLLRVVPSRGRIDLKKTYVTMSSRPR